MRHNLDSQPRTKGGAVLSVRDSGVGIDRELLPHIFDLFTQAQRSLDRSQAGLGVGLTVVRKLVEMQRGTVGAYSKGLGQGSEFVVRFPLLTSATPRPEIVTREGTKQAAQSGRVLVVDDNADAADSVAILFGAAGYVVRVAYSANSALQTAVEYQPHVVLLDIGLPEMDGYEVAQHLRQHAELTDTKLVALTGYGQDADRNVRKSQGLIITWLSL
jgi:CheY-like chemotaxis protein